MAKLSSKHKTPVEIENVVREWFVERLSHWNDPPRAIAAADALLIKLREKNLIIADASRDQKKPARRGKRERVVAYAGPTFIGASHTANLLR